MNYSPAATDFDRLPWLEDEAKPRAKGVSRPLLGWGAAAALLIAGGSYWYGMTGGEPTETRTAPPQATAPLPEPRAAPAPVPEVRPAPMRQVEPVAPPPAVRIPDAPPTRSSAAIQQTATAPNPWPAMQSAGAAGRMVRIGEFDSRYQAKRGWVRLARAYPGMQRLPAVVIARRSARSGVTRYRLQIGTTSQAHSTVLCQRMRIIGQSCAIVGSPRAEGERG